MNMTELQARLEAECFNFGVVHVGPRWDWCGDTYCLAQEGETFEVFYVERGQKGTVFGTFKNEEDACASFYERVSREKWNRAHCLGLFAEESKAESLVKLLRDGGIEDIHRDVIPHTEPHRVFVFGTDVIKAKDIMEKSNIPLHGTRGDARP